MFFPLFDILNKKYQTRALNKIFDFIELLYLTMNLFDSKNKAKDLKMFSIYKKIIKKFMVDDEYLIKVDKSLMRIIDEYNNTKKKPKKKLVCKDDVSSSSSDTTEHEDDPEYC